MKDINIDEIKFEAKQIMDKFIKQLDGIEVEKDFQIQREVFMREEQKETQKQDNFEFKQKFLENAANKNSDYILTKKGDWI